MHDARQSATYSCKLDIQVLQLLLTVQVSFLYACTGMHLSWHGHYHWIICTLCFFAAGVPEAAGSVGGEETVPTGGEVEGENGGTRGTHHYHRCRCATIGFGSNEAMRDTEKI